MQCMLALPDIVADIEQLCNGGEADQTDDYHVPEYVPLH